MERVRAVETGEQADFLLPRSYNAPPGRASPAPVGGRRSFITLAAQSWLLCLWAGREEWGGLGSCEMLPTGQGRVTVPGTFLCVQRGQAP